MPDEISHALALLIGALTTAVLMAASYYWGPKQGNSRPDKDSNNNSVQKRKRERRSRPARIREIDFEDE